MQNKTQDLVAALAKLIERYPQWRFGQLVCNVAAWAGEPAPHEVENVSEEAMLKAAQSHLARLEPEAKLSIEERRRRAAQAVERLHRTSVANATDQISDKEIDDEIRAARQERR
jgi:hypothetical protein